ncbi:MAG TPA: hypothetical protein VG710_14495 [Opitutus sp.]|nr:hypothetical protein [Opitutus sp.]
MKRADRRFRSHSRRLVIVLVALAILVPGGYFAARDWAWPAYKDWREARLEHMANDFLAAKDYDNALITARRALRGSRQKPEYWKIAAAASKAMGQPDAIFYQERVVKLDDTLENRIELIRLALSHEDYHDAIDAIEGAGPAAKQSVDFHQLAAEVYGRVGRTVPARLHLYSLLSLRPDDKPAQLELAALELSDDTTRTNATVREKLRQLSQDPELRVRALALLLQDAVTGHDRAKAVEYAEQLNASKKLGDDQKVLVLAGLALGAPDRATEYQRRLEDAFRNDPGGVVALARYFENSGSQTDARQWLQSLPRNMQVDLKVQEAIASDYLAWQDWPRLDQAVSSEQWKDRDFMRHAFAAYSARQSGRTAEAGSEWRLAVIQAGNDVGHASELLRLLGQWGWQAEQYDVVWKLFALMPRNQEVTGQLIAWERAQGHTANLNRIFAKLVEFSGDDLTVKNNFAYTSLLLDANLSKAFELARSNYDADPKNPYYVTTEALALYKQDKSDEALAMLEKLDAPQLSSPERTLLHALFLAAAGRADRAADLLGGVKTKALLPEERQLAQNAEDKIAALEREHGQDLRLVALSHRGDIDRRKGWLAVMPEKVQATATDDMKTSDSLFAIGDIDGLGTQLRNQTWKQHEYLRMALVAYVARHRGNDAEARSYWGTALGAAAGDQERLDQLAALASHWQWEAERMDVLTRLFEIDASDPATLTQLLQYYRSAGRTAELVSVLSAYLSAHPDDEARRSVLAYYRMLSGLDVTRAYVAAHDAYEAAPDDGSRRLVYAFALWKQHRSAEAWKLLQASPDGGRDLVPVALLRAAVLSDLDRHDDAVQALNEFDRAHALPEESTLASVLASRLKSNRAVSQL